MAGRPSQREHKKVLKMYLKERDDWATAEIREFVLEEFDVGYTLKQIRVILKGFKMKHGKPYPHDFRRPDDAEE